MQMVLIVMLKALQLEKSEGVNSSLVFGSDRLQDTLRGDITVDYFKDQPGTSTFWA